MKHQLATQIILNMKAVWNGKTIAESNDIVKVENNCYFPEESVNREYLEKTNTHTTCPWKGVASYYSLVVDGNENHDAAWYYADPSPDASAIKGHIAFWKGVQITD
jgi:uncharacterized protein (DUF427 family)